MARKIGKGLRYSLLNGGKNVVKLNPDKHPVSSGMVPLVNYVPPKWNYIRVRSN